MKLDDVLPARPAPMPPGPPTIDATVARPGNLAVAAKVRRVRPAIPEPTEATAAATVARQDNPAVAARVRRVRPAIPQTTEATAAATVARRDNPAVAAKVRRAWLAVTAARAVVRREPQAHVARVRQTAARQTAARQTAAWQTAAWVLPRPLARVLARVMAIAFAGALAACAPAGPEHDLPQRLTPSGTALPPMRLFSDAHPAAPERSNAEIAEDILELGFFMESGRPIARFSRFDGPVALRLVGAPQVARIEAERLVARFRREAGIPISLAPDAAGGIITVQFVTQRRMQAVVPEAACFVVPRVASWAEFRRSRRSPQLDWTTLDRREKVAVFIPADVTAQEIRDCLHEEVAQALGPLNDLYRLHDSVFNDDNFQTVLTGFDMLALRVWHDPAFHSGMTREAFAARLPQVLERLNPQGERMARRPRGSLPTPRPWVEAMQQAHGPDADRPARRAAARRAVALAEAQGWQDARMAFSLFTLGRLARPTEGDLAIDAFLRAGTIYRALPGAEAHVAHVDMQVAAFALSMGRFNDVMALTRSAEATAIATENAALLASIRMVQAEALDRLGRGEEARARRLDSLGWARYGFGADDRVHARLAEIAALVPPGAGLRPGAGTGDRRE